MAFEDITLLKDEEKLLREMADKIPRDKSTPYIMGLRGYELVEMIQEYTLSGNNSRYQMLYKITEYGERYLLYLDKKDSVSASENANNKEMMRLTHQGITISKIAAIASVASAILAIVAIAVTIALRQ